MTILEAWTVQSNAKRDATAGVDSRDDVVKALLGERPMLDPSKPDHRRVEVDLNLDAEIQTRENQLEALEDRRAHEPTIVPINLVLGLCYVSEPMACVSLMASYGFLNPEKTIFGVMLAAGIFGITSIAARLSGRARYAVCALYAGLVVAVAGSRLAERGDGSVTSGAEAIVLVFLTVGPALLAEWCWRRRAPGAILAKQTRLVRRRLADVRGRRERAQQYVNKITTAERRWENDATLIRSAYAKEHRRRGGSPGWSAQSAGPS